MENIDSDVLVVGGGLAAIRAAMAAQRAGAKTAIVLKGVLGKSGSSAIAGGGLAAVLGVSDVRDDSPERHFMDTLTAGDFVNDPDLVRQLVLRAPQAIRELEEFGAEFVRKPGGEIEVFLAPAHSCRRSVRVAGGGTGRLMGPLADSVRRAQISVYENATVLDLLQHDGHAAGAVAVMDGDLVLIRAKAIVLATGGAGRIYPLTSTMEEATGDGCAMALRNRLALTGMEFVQFTPTALAYPKALEGTSTGGVLLGLPGTRLWNERGERFMERYDPERKEASTRAILSRAIQTEVVEGRGSSHGGVYLDLTRNDFDTLQRLAAPFMTKLAPFNIDITRDRIEIAPAVHYFMGGVEINAVAETGIPGLYAAGEVAGGVQGSNRLSSNSLSDVNVFGAIAGGQAANYAQNVERQYAWKTLDEYAKDLVGSCIRKSRPPRDEALAVMHAELKRIMFSSAGIVRDASGLASGLIALSALRERLTALAPVATADARRFYELRNMLDVGEAVIRCAAHRTETRGAHYRSDYPERNDSRWLVATRVYRDGDEMKILERDLSGNRQYMKP